MESSNIRNYFLTTPFSILTCEQNQLYSMIFKTYDFTWLTTAIMIYYLLYDCSSNLSLGVENYFCYQSGFKASGHPYHLKCRFILHWFKKYDLTSRDFWWFLTLMLLLFISLPGIRRQDLSLAIQINESLPIKLLIFQKLKQSF